MAVISRHEVKNYAPPPPSTMDRVRWARIVKSFESNLDTSSPETPSVSPVISVQAKGNYDSLMELYYAVE